MVLSKKTENPQNNVTNSNTFAMMQRPMAAKIELSADVYSVPLLLALREMPEMTFSSRVDITTIVRMNCRISVRNFAGNTVSVIKDIPNKCLLTELIWHWMKGTLKEVEARLVDRMDRCKGGGLSQRVEEWINTELSVNC